MAKRVVVLGQTDSNPNRWQVLFWVPVKAAHQFRYARAGATSRWPGASQAENDAIASGAVREVVDVCEQAPGASIGDIGTNLLARWTALKTQQDADPFGSFYGTYNDDVGGWSVDSSKA